MNKDEVEALTRELADERSENHQLRESLMKIELEAERRKRFWSGFFVGVIVIILLFVAWGWLRW